MAVRSWGRLGGVSNCHREAGSGILPWPSPAHVLAKWRPGGGVAGAGEGPAKVEKDVEEHQDTEIVCFAGTRSWVVCAKIPR
jgi:hypothetical protein